MDLWLRSLTVTVSAVLVKCIDRQASLIVLPPLVLGYEELYEDYAATTRKTSNRDKNDNKDEIPVQDKIEKALRTVNRKNVKTHTRSEELDDYGNVREEEIGDMQEYESMSMQEYRKYRSKNKNSNVKKYKKVNKQNEHERKLDYIKYDSAERRTINPYRTAKAYKALDKVKKRTHPKSEEFDKYNKFKEVRGEALQDSRKLREDYISNVGRYKLALQQNKHGSKTALRNHDSIEKRVVKPYKATNEHDTLRSPRKTNHKERKTKEPNVLGAAFEKLAISEGIPDYLILDQLEKIKGNANNIVKEQIK